MTKEDFLQIFKSGFHKLSLKKVLKVGESKNNVGRKYYIYLGLFEFTPPQQIWCDEQINYDFLNKLLKEFNEELSNCIVRKFTRKVLKNGNMVKKNVVRYVFDIIPKNILSFKFNKSTKTMKVVVRGYGMTK